MKRLLLFLLPILLFGCSEELIIGNDIPESTDQIQSRSSGDGKYDVLGYGYDVTYEYFNASPQSMKAQVIDVDAYVKNGEAWDYNLNPSSYGEMIVGSTAQDFVSQMTSHGDIKIGADVFTGSLEANFSTYYEYSSKYSIAQYFMYIRQKQIYLNAATSELIPYLTSKFKEDLQTKSSTYIIAHYGTHVLTNNVLGARLTVTYRSLVTSETSAKRETVKAGCSSNILSVFQINVNESYRDSLITKNKEQLLIYKTEGGDPSKALVGTLNLDSSVTPQVNISSWQNSCNTSNMVLIDAIPGTVIPLYEFVSDATKRNELKLAIEEYATQRSYIDVGDPIPLYQYSFKAGTLYNCDNKYYTIDYDEYGQGKDGYLYNKIVGYVFSSAFRPSGSIPLYKYRAEFPSYETVGGRTHRIFVPSYYYTTDWKGEECGGVKGRCVSELPCYIYKYYYIGIACYVYPKNAKIPTAYSLYNELATSHDEDGNIAGFTVTKTLTLDPENAELDCKILPVMKPQ